MGERMVTDAGATGGRAAAVWRLLPAALAALATAVLLTLPLAHQVTTAAGPTGAATSGRSVTLPQQEGWGVLPALAVPPLLAAAPLALPRRRQRPAHTAAAALLTLYVLLAAASVGLFYAPAAIAEIVAAVGAWRKR